MLVSPSAYQYGEGSPPRRRVGAHLWTRFCWWREKQDLIVHESGSDANSQAGGDAIAVEGGKRLIGVYLRRDDVGCSTIL
jgi:hypothetical protein